jgi:hypothetical protein
MKNLFLSAFALAAVAACDDGGKEPANSLADGPAKVATSGKVPVDLDKIPPAVIAAVKASEPNLVLTEASSETRDGRNYYDVEGEMPDGSELEFDLLEEGGSWRVVERQRDIEFAAIPEPVRASFAKVPNPYTPARVIESTQSDGLVIYELFAAAPHGAEPRKVEVKYDGERAELLTAEWAH